MVNEGQMSENTRFDEGILRTYSDSKVPDNDLARHFDNTVRNGTPLIDLTIFKINKPPHSECKALHFLNSEN